MERLRKDALKLENESLMRKKKLQEQAFQDQQRTYEQNINQLLERMEKERKTAREDNERVLTAKLRVRNERHQNYQNPTYSLFIHILYTFVIENVNTKHLQ